MFIKDWKKDLFTIPNMLSLFRLLLIPVYVVIYLNADADIDYYIAGGILAVSCLTDMIDGQIARHFNMISTIGKILDPLADKVTQFTLIVCLAIEYPVLIPPMVLRQGSIPACGRIFDSAQRQNAHRRADYRQGFHRSALC